MALRRDDDFTQGAFSRSLPDTLPANTAILDTSGTIVAVNEHWRAFAAANDLGLPDHGVGANYVELCRSLLGSSHRLTTELSALLSGRLALMVWPYPCNSPDQERWFVLIGVPRGNTGGAVLLHLDLTHLVVPGRTTASLTDIGLQSKLVSAARSSDPELGQALERAVRAAIESFAGRHPDAQEEGEATRAQEQEDAVPFSLIRALSTRQLEVLHLIGEGMTNAEIGQALGIPTNTVKSRVSALLKRLGLSNRARAAALAARYRPPPPRQEAEARIGGATVGGSEPKRR